MSIQPLRKWDDETDHEALLTDEPSALASDVPEGAPFLRKPFTLGSLLNKVREVLQPKLA